MSARYSDVAASRPQSTSGSQVPGSIGTLELPNRIFMSAMTRTRATPDNVPTEVMAEYFAQRAGAG